MISRTAIGLALLVAATAHAAPPEIRYTVDTVAGAAKHRVDVTMEIDAAPSPLDLSMPVWTPGSYERRDWGRNVSAVRLTDGEHGATTIHRTGPDSWRVEGQTSGATVTLAYRVFADQLADDSSQIDLHHANLLGTSIFLRAHGLDDRPHRVSFVVVKEARIATALDGEGTQRSAPNYEALVDAPIEIGGFTEGVTRAAGRSLSVVIDAIDGREPVPRRLLDDLAAIAEAEARMAGPPPFSRYLFILHLADGPGRIVALEHRASSSVVVPRDALTGDDYQDLLYIAAHELFHAWNARLLRPAELVPIDFDHPRPSRALWITEGLTEYFAHRAMLASHRWSEGEYLRHVAEEAARVELDATHATLTLEEQAELTWHNPDLAEGDPDVYYARGHLATLALDLFIRARSDGKHSLDEVVRALCETAARAGGALPIDTDRLARATAALLGSSSLSATLAELEALARRAGAPPLGDALASVGLRLEVLRGPSRPSLGLVVEADRGQLRIAAVMPDGAAARAGLKAGDRILTVDGAAPPPAWPEDQRTPVEGRITRLEAQRADRRLVVPVVLEDHPSIACRLVRVPGVSPSVKRLRDGWLR